MFIGHFAVALAAKRAAPATSLGTLVLAAQFVDLLWPVLLLAGVERVVIDPGNTAVTPLDFVHYPWSHSLVMSAFWALAAGVAYWLVRRNARAALVVGAVVLSHWLLDALAHRPDLPLAPGGEARIGFGLWNSVVATLLVEGAMFGAALWLYLGATRARDVTGAASLWTFVGFLVVIYAGAVFGPPPPDVRAIAWTGIGMWLLVAWGWWIDRHRAPAREG